MKFPRILNFLFPCSPGWTQVLSMTHTAAYNATDIRRRAQALKANPVPLLTKSDLKARWQVESFQTIKRVLKSHHVTPTNSGRSQRELYKLTDILGIEGVDDPLTAWALGREKDRDTLKAPLLTPAEVRKEDNWLVPQHLESIRRNARSGMRPGIKIGRQWRFRQTRNDECDTRDEAQNDEGSTTYPKGCD